MNREPEFEPQDIPSKTTEPVIVEPAEEQAEVLVTAPEAPPPVSPVVVDPTVVEVDRRIRGGMFGVPEIIGAALGGLVLLGVLGFYFLAVAPAASDLKAKKAQRDEQEKKLTELKSRFDKNEKTGNIVANLEQSVSDFEFRYLPIASIGRTGLYDRINGLMYAYHLRNTAGPDYAPLEIVTQGNDQPQEERGKNKFQTLFPGVYINMTVEGTYPNLRRFIGEIENSPQFVIISTVELQATENKEQEDTTKFQAPPVQQPGANPGNPGMGGGRMPGPGLQQQQPKPAVRKGKTMGEVVSLHIELAAYFRRDTAPVTTLPAEAAP